MRITQQNIAEALNIHRSTVSLALQNHPNVNKTTATKVRATAKRLGYSPDPMLSALSAYRNRRRPATFHGTLGWIVCHKAQLSWREVPHYLEYFEGGKGRAAQLGYKLEEFIFDPKKITADRFTSILQARNIRGLLICPQLQPYSTIDFLKTNFSAVSFGYSLISPQLHTVTASHYRAVKQCIAQLRARGYSRIGLVIPRIDDQKVDNICTSAFLGEEFAANIKPVPPCLDDNVWINTTELRVWFHKHRPDAIITNVFRLREFLQNIGVKVPKDVGLAGIALPNTEWSLSGVIENSRHIGALAVDQVTSMIMHGECGFPKLPQRTLVEGYWHEGGSLRAIPKKGKTHSKN